MAIKKGDLVKVIELEDGDSNWGVELNETYKVISVCDDCVEIDAGKGDRWMFNHNLQKVKKKSKKDLRIEELENTIEKILTYLVNK